MRIRVVTDSSANVPDGYLSRLGIAEAPALVNFAGRSYLNKVELSNEEFYRRLAASDVLPTTSQPTPGHFADAYARLAAEGAKEIIAVCVSGRLSGTLNSATLAARQAPVPVHLWDSLNASIGAGWQAIAAAEMAAAGLEPAAILARLAALRDRMQVIFTPASLRHIIASGRVPKLRGTVGELLNIKPILVAAHGLLEPVTQVRTRRRALEVMVERLASALGMRPLRLAVGHANARDEAEAYMATIRGRLNVAEGVVFDVGPALATLGGPGLIGVCAHTLEDT